MARIIIVEDDLLIADLLEDVLVDAGYDVCGIASNVAEAVDLCDRRRPDLAVLDLRLADGDCGTEIAARVKGDHKPGILYATANARTVPLTAVDGEACITKPYHCADIVQALQIVSELADKGKTSRPFPANFRILR